MDGRGYNERDVEMATICNTRDKRCDNLISAFFGRQRQKQKRQPFDNPHIVKITQLPNLQILLIYELRPECWLSAYVCTSVRGPSYWILL